MSIPGGEIKEKLDFLEANGFASVEIPSGDWPIKNGDALIAALKGRKLFLATACGPSDFSSAEPEKREAEESGGPQEGPPAGREDEADSQPGEAPARAVGDGLKLVPVVGLGLKTPPFQDNYGRKRLGPIRPVVGHFLCTL